MTTLILLSSLIIVLCVFMNRFSQRFGIPVLLAFIGLGLIFGTDGLFRIPFDNYELAEKICSMALIFIMFYGGFGTRWKQAKKVAFKAGLLATLGVALTAFITALLCHYLLKMGWIESWLIGSVISSTDAATVFSILRSKKLGLKENSDSMLELESGSNDPCSYMLTLIVLSTAIQGVNVWQIGTLLLNQFFFGSLIGCSVGFGSVWLMKHFKFNPDGFDIAFVAGIALFSYAAATMLNGNGYLSVYLCGIILGNQSIRNQKSLVPFFDGITGLMQMLIFFLLGLLATPSRIPQIFLTACAIMLIITLIARPLSVFVLLSPFRCSINQQLLVSFAGLRGAASIVFAILVTVSDYPLTIDLYHLVFCIVLLSITFQGSFLPSFAKWVQMTDPNIDVLKTFSDYSEQIDLRFIQVKLKEDHDWTNQIIKDIVLPPDMMIVMIIRASKQIIPNGKTMLKQSDTVILSAYKYNDEYPISLREYPVSEDDEWIGKTIHEFSPYPNELVIVLIRNDKAIIPRGRVKIKANDILVIHCAQDEI